MTAYCNRILGIGEQKADVPCFIVYNGWSGGRRIKSKCNQKRLFLQVSSLTGFFLDSVIRD